LKVCKKTWAVFILTCIALFLNLSLLLAIPKWIRYIATFACIMANFIAIRQNGWPPIFKPKLSPEDRMQCASIGVLFLTISMTFLSSMNQFEPKTPQQELQDVATDLAEIQQDLKDVLTNMARTVADKIEKDYADIKTEKQRVEFRNEIISFGTKAVVFSREMFGNTKNLNLQVDMLKVIEKLTKLELSKIYSDNLVSDQEKKYVLKMVEQWIETNLDADDDDE